MAWLAIGGALLGGISSAVSTSSQNAQAQEAADRQNKYAREAADRQNKYNREVYDFQVKEQERQYDYAVEGLEITKRNNEANLGFQETERTQKYDYGMGIRAYEHNQNIRAWDAQVSGAVQQIRFNELAERAAVLDQDRLIHEQLLSISFDETETLLNYGAAAAGVGLQKRQVKAGAVTQAQATRISALKATGAAQARGAGGRSAARNIQGMVAEVGARQAAIIDELMYNTEATEQQLFKMNAQLLLDKAGFEVSRLSAQMSDISARTKIKAQTLQADIDARNRIGLKPEIAPPLPVPLALPRPEYLEVFKPGVPPPPMEVVPFQQAAVTSNLFSSVIGGALSGAQMGASIQSSFGSGNWQGQDQSSTGNRTSIGQATGITGQGIYGTQVGPNLISSGGPLSG